MRLPAVYTENAAERVLFSRFFYPIESGVGFSGFQCGFVDSLVSHEAEAPSAQTTVSLP